MYRKNLGIDVSIIIVNFNTSNLINDCIATIKRQTIGISYEIIVVDNATENLSDTIKVDKEDKIIFVQLPKNVGFGAANNAGVEKACGEYVFFLNPDTLLLNNAVKILYEYLKANPQCGGCGGNLYDREGHPIHSYRRVLPGIMDSLNILSNQLLPQLIWGDNHENNRTGHPMKVGYVTGADLMIPTKVFKDVGGFDSQFFLYYEETDLCCRIKDKGYYLASVPEAEIIHLVGQSHKDEKEYTPNEFVFKCEGFSRNLYYNKHLSGTKKLISKCILFVNFQLRLLIFTLKKNKSQQKLWRFRTKYL